MVAIAEELVTVGVFERRGSKESPQYWIPFLYRDGLDISQGTADESDSGARPRTATRSGLRKIIEPRSTVAAGRFASAQ
jgi:hypothetical protein